jgi:hypothetical protein
MKNFKLSLIAILAMGTCSIANADSLTQALQNGKVSGEFTATYENRNVDKELTKWSNYYNNTSYGVGSFALKYETGIWNNISLTSKVRAYATLFEGGKDETHYQGKGDASERFYEKNGSSQTADIEELFLTYGLENVTVKAGRQFIATDWINKTQDALRVNANFSNTSLEAIWSKRHGRVYSRDYRPVSEMNDDEGVYKIALTQKFTENISATAYDFIAPDVRDIIGGKVNLKYGDTSIRAHYAVNKDDNDSTKDSSIIDLMLSTKIGGFSPYAGYVQIDKDAAFTHMAGETIIPFEEGDQMYLKNAKTYYVGVSKSFGKLSSTLLYGATSYDKGTKNYTQKEATVWLGYPITKDLKSNLGYTIVRNDKADTNETDLDQVNVTLTYSF